MAIKFKDVAVGDRFAEIAECRTPGRVWIVEKKVRGVFGKRPNQVRMWSRCEGPGVVAIDYSISEINRLFAPVDEDPVHEAPTEPQDPRASRMPEHIPSIDPLFADAAFREFTPEQEAMVREKVGR